MKFIKISVVAITLLVALFPIIPQAQSVNEAAALPFICNWADMIMDVTVPDGTNMLPNTPFTKVWRLKNIGACTWTTDYSIVYSYGDQMDAPTVTKLSENVPPGGTVDFTLSMVTPKVEGHFRGYWQLMDSKGTRFGIGLTTQKPFWVDIIVKIPLVTLLDFNVCSGYWSSATELIPCTYDASIKSKGYVIKLDDPVLENGNHAGVPGLLTVPPDKYDSVIHGAFQLPELWKGDRFEAVVGCQYGAMGCNVNFTVSIYDVRLGKEEIVWALKDKYDGRFYSVEVNLERFVGKKDIFLILSAAANGASEGDYPLWINPRVLRPVLAPMTPLPQTPTLTFTATPTKQPDYSTSIPPPPGCEKAQFIADVNVPDGTVFFPEQPFTKTWRLMNNGDCTWDQTYSLVFDQGDQMGGLAVIPLNQQVQPGQTIDLTVNLKAPQTPGAYRGYWKIRNSFGKTFGIGPNGNDPFWVAINVAGDMPQLNFDFVTGLCQGSWTSGAGVLPCPGSDGGISGVVQRAGNPTLSNGVTDARPAIFVSLTEFDYGWMQGAFPEILVKTDDHFQATVSCQYQVISCDVFYRLDYQIGSDPASTLWSYHATYQEAAPYNVDVDLSMFTGKKVKFILTILSNGSSNGDRIYWVAPRITHSNSYPTTATPTTINIGYTYTPTSIPFFIPETPSPVSINDQLVGGSAPETGIGDGDPYGIQVGDDKLTRGSVQIDSVDAVMLMTYPQQTILSVKGKLPTSCHQLRAIVNKPDANNRIMVDIYSVFDPTAICADVLKPFNVSLSFGGIPTGHYVIWMNGQQIGELDL